MDPFRFAVLMAGGFFLAFGLVAYRWFYAALGAAAGLALWIALSDSLVKIPGLREHPGTSSFLVLVLMISGGVLLATRYRKTVTFFSGLAVGLILSRAVSVYMAEAGSPGPGMHLGSVDGMDILAGLVGGVLFVLFERFLALVLTSVVGAFLVAWALESAWTFPVCIAIGLVAQPLVIGSLGRPSKPGSGGGPSGRAAAALFFLLVPALSAAAAVGMGHLRMC